MMLTRGELLRAVDILHPGHLSVDNFEKRPGLPAVRSVDNESGFSLSNREIHILSRGPRVGADIEGVRVAGRLGVSPSISGIYNDSKTALVGVKWKELIVIDTGGWIGGSTVPDKLIYFKER